MSKASGRSFVREHQTIITPTVAEVAAAWCAMDADEQARFFELVYDISSGWSAPLCFQLQAVSDSEMLTASGRAVMRWIGEYSDPGQEAGDE